jgi:hypothetical protein
LIQWQMIAGTAISAFSVARHRAKVTMTMTKHKLIGYGVALVLLLGAILCASPYPSQAQADPTILARQAELAATAQIVRAANEAAARERARIAAEAAAEAARMRAEAEATAIVIHAQGTAAAAQATAAAIVERTATANAMAQATGTAQARGTQIASTATQIAGTATAAPIRTAEALAYRATVQAQAAESLALMVRYTLSIRLNRPVVFEVAQHIDQGRGDEEAEGANVTDDPGFASVIVENVTESMEREAAQ